MVRTNQIITGTKYSEFYLDEKVFNRKPYLFQTLTNLPSKLVL
jgi:hypothetical protein